MLETKGDGGAELPIAWAKHRMALATTPGRQSLAVGDGGEYQERRAQRAGPPIFEPLRSTATIDKRDGLHHQRKAHHARRPAAPVQRR